MILFGNRETNSLVERVYIALILLRYGVGVKIKSGKLFYLPYMRKCKCKSLDLIRHGKTIAVENGEFMSNSSKNSILSTDGILELKNVVRDINRISPEVILVAPIDRTVKTYEILKQYLSCDTITKKCEYMVGINNSVWGDKKFESLDCKNLYIFLLRECGHNIFCKTLNGDSWGDVLIRCAKLLNELNNKYSSKKVLLISQGSVYQGLKILLHCQKHPWQGYSAGAMFGTLRGEKQIGYGRIFNIC